MGSMIHHRAILVSVLLTTATDTDMHAPYCVTATEHEIKIYKAAANLRRARRESVQTLIRCERR